eukprot:m.1332 g.1332  ORF g.1332 m.1332 type:complete len:176 (+) comp6144_c0_seq1:76-603(+)
MADEKVKRRVEFGKVFEYWKASKQEQKRAALAAQAKVRREEEERQEAKRTAGLLAYQRWKAAKQREYESEVKERQRIREKEKAEQGAKFSRFERSRMAFDGWKERKEFELKEKRRDSLPEIKRRASTPNLPGYCSVWGCDAHLAMKMERNCPRPPAPRIRRLFSHSFPSTIQLTQ